MSSHAVMSDHSGIIRDYHTFSDFEECDAVDEEEQPNDKGEGLFQDSSLLNKKVKMTFIQYQAWPSVTPLEVDQFRSESYQSIALSEEIQCSKVCDSLCTGSSSCDRSYGCDYQLDRCHPKIAACVLRVLPTWSCCIPSTLNLAALWACIHSAGGSSCIPLLVNFSAIQIGRLCWGYRATQYDDYFNNSCLRFSESSQKTHPTYETLANRIFPNRAAYQKNDITEIVLDYLAGDPSSDEVTYDEQLKAILRHNRPPRVLAPFQETWDARIEAIKASRPPSQFEVGR